MKLSHKLGKLLGAEAYKSAQRHLRRDFRKLGASFANSDVKLPFELTAENFLREIDGPEFRAIQERYAVATPTIDPPKYISDPLAWLNINIKRIRELDLDYGWRRDVLDIGCGAGYFLHLCSRLGHRPIGLDLDEEPIFREMTKLLRVDRRIWRIEARQPLPDFGRRFDLVTAHLICFNGHKSEDLWGVDEWAFLLTDLERHLKPNGEILFRMNTEYNGASMSPELIHFFGTELSGNVEGNNVHLHRRRFSNALAKRVPPRSPKGSAA